MVKALVHCIGKILKINCLFDTLIEPGTFGIKTVGEVGSKIIWWYADTIRGAWTKMEWFWGKRWCKFFSKNLFTSFKDFQNNDKEMKKSNHLKINVTNYCAEKSRMCNKKN